MAKFAILGGDIVINTIIADNLEDAQRVGEAVEFTNENPAGIGWIYNRDTGTFSEPAVEEESVPPVEEEPNA